MATSKLKKVENSPQKQKAASKEKFKGKFCKDEVIIKT